MRNHIKGLRARLGNRKGIMIVWLALFLLPLLLIFLGLAVDIGYMYFVKNQLQVAADAAALAGAGRLISPPLLDTGANFAQLEARQEAWKFACKNTAAGDPVFLVTGGSASCDPPNSGLNEAGNDPNGDIVIGNWDQASRTFTPATGSTGLRINAVKVRPRRTGETPGMPAVRVFVGQIFRLLGIDWTFLHANASAIAARLPRATAPISLCTRTCEEIAPITNATSPQALFWTSKGVCEDVPGNAGIAWTIFSETSQATPTKELTAFLCGKEVDACNKTVYSSNGYNQEAARQFWCAFQNPEYDAANKDFDASGKVIRWRVIVPIFEPDGCPPGDQPRPYKIMQFGEVSITYISSSGAGGKGDCACGAYDAPKAPDPPVPPVLPTGYENCKFIVVDGIRCVACDDPSLVSRKSVLVQ